MRAGEVRCDQAAGNGVPADGAVLEVEQSPGIQRISQDRARCILSTGVWIAVREIAQPVAEVDHAPANGLEPFQRADQGFEVGWNHRLVCPAAWSARGSYFPLAVRGSSLRCSNRLG